MSIDPEKLKSVLDTNKDKKKIARRIIERNPQTLPIIPKLTSDGEGNQQNTGQRLTSNAGILLELHNKLRNMKENNRAIIQLFPDIEMAIQIIVSSILSPKKMTETNLLYSINKSKNIPPSISAPLVEMLKDYMDEEYNLEGELPQIIREALFESGSYVKLVVPEASLDDIINKDLLSRYSREQFESHVGQVKRKAIDPINLTSKFKDKPEKISASTESVIHSLINKTTVNITDNPNILAYADMKQDIQRSLIKESMRGGSSVSVEHRDKLSYLDIFRSNQGQSSLNMVDHIKPRKQASRKSMGKPMVVKIPTESIIPVFIPGSTSDHVSYLILLDESGRPLNVDNRESDVSSITNSLITNDNAEQTPIQKAYRNLVASSTSNVDMRGLFEIYKSVMEDQIYETINDSVYGGDVDISNKNDIFFLMFTRALSGRQTNILFAPKDIVNYFAFQYNELGIGKSLLENLSILSSLRAILLFSKVMGQVKQSIDVTNVDVQLDPNDPDPEKTIEQIQDGVLKLRQNFMPLGINNPVDLVNWIQKAGLRFSYSNNPRIPDVQLDFSNDNIQHTLPDGELEEDLRRQTILALGLSPETVDDSFSPDFATTVVTNNLLLSKRIAIYQKTLCRQLEEYIERIIYNDMDLRSEIREIILAAKDSVSSSLDEDEKSLLLKDEEAFVDYYIDYISESININLPRPEHATLENMSVEFDQYVDGLEKVLNHIVSAEFFTDDFTGEISNYIDTIKEIYKGHCVRKWMAENNYYVEALDISSVENEDVDHLLESITSHMSSTMRNGTKLLSVLKRFKKAVNVDLTKIMSDDNEEDEDSGFGPMDDSGSGGDDVDTDEDDDDPFGF